MMASQNKKFQVGVVQLAYGFILFICVLNVVAACSDNFLQMMDNLCNQNSRYCTQPMMCGRCETTDFCRNRFLRSVVDKLPPLARRQHNDPNVQCHTDDRDGRQGGACAYKNVMTCEGFYFTATNQPRHNPEEPGPALKVLYTHPTTGVKNEIHWHMDQETAIRTVQKKGEIDPTTGRQKAPTTDRGTIRTYSKFVDICKQAVAEHPDYVWIYNQQKVKRGKTKFFPSHRPNTLHDVKRSYTFF